MKAITQTALFVIIVLMLSAAVVGLNVGAVLLALTSPYFTLAGQFVFFSIVAFLDAFALIGLGVAVWGDE